MTLISYSGISVEKCWVPHPKILYELSEHFYVFSYNNLMEQMLLHWEVITHSG